MNNKLINETQCNGFYYLYFRTGFKFIKFPGHNECFQLILLPRDKFYPCLTEGTLSITITQLNQN